jgi:PHD/YefM family antitoxin component YafN of YafNO toxin-antitoxin module
MLTVHPQYIKDANGEKTLVILPVEEFNSLMEELEEMEDIRLYDEAKKNDTGERITMEEAFKRIETKRKMK